MSSTFSAQLERFVDDGNLHVSVRFLTRSTWNTRSLQSFNKPCGSIEHFSPEFAIINRSGEQNVYLFGSFDGRRKGSPRPSGSAAAKSKVKLKGIRSCVCVCVARAKRCNLLALHAQTQTPNPMANNNKTSQSEYRFQSNFVGFANFVCLLGGRLHLPIQS